MVKVIKFWEAVESLNSNIILGCESWLTEEIANEEVIPSNLTIYRKDRPDGYGGVFIAHSNKIITIRETFLETICELVACSTMMRNGRKLFIISFYRPNDSNLHLDEFLRPLT